VCRSRVIAILVSISVSASGCVGGSSPPSGSQGSTPSLGAVKGTLEGRVFTTACGGPAASSCRRQTYRGSLVFCKRADRALPVGPRRRPRPLRDHAQGGALRARSGSRQAERRDGDPTVGVDRSRAGDDARHQRRQRDVLSGALPAAVRVRRVRPQVRLRGRRRRAPRLRGRPARCGRRGHWRSLDGARCRGDTAARRPSGASPEHRGTASTPRDRSHDGRTLTPHASSNHARLLPRRPPRSLTPARDGAYPRARFRLRGVEMPLRFAPPRWPEP